MVQQTLEQKVQRIYRIASVMRLASAGGHPES